MVHEQWGEEKKKRVDSLLSIIIEELSSTLTAVIVGLAFSNARDVCLNTLSIRRKGIMVKEKADDLAVAAKYRTMFMVTVNEMKIRYTGERRKREMAQLKAYDDNSQSTTSQDQSAREREAANANLVENLLLGNTQEDESNPLLYENHFTLLHVLSLVIYWMIFWACIMIWPKSL